MSYSLEDFYNAADQQKDHSPFCTVVKGWGHNRFVVLEGWWENGEWEDRPVDIFTAPMQDARAQAKDWAAANGIKYVENERLNFSTKSSSN